MSWLDKLERKLSFLTIHNLTVYLVVGQALGFLVFMLKGSDGVLLLHKMSFQFAAFIGGEPWRIVSFMLVPKVLSPIWIIFALYFLYLMGSALEASWGAFRYNLFILTGVLGVLATGALFPQYELPNIYILSSIFIAFALLHPNFEILLFFILPVKVKWICLLTVLWVAVEFFAGGIVAKTLILGSLANIPLFFGSQFVQSLRSGARRRELHKQKKAIEAEPFHVCIRCGATDKSHPELEFRYTNEGAVCSDCSSKKE